MSLAQTDRVLCGVKGRSEAPLCCKESVRAVISWQQFNGTLDINISEFQSHSLIAVTKCFQLNEKARRLNKKLSK